LRVDLPLAGGDKAESALLSSYAIAPRAAPAGDQAYSFSKSPLRASFPARLAIAMVLK
jgi:hypothetical protein